METTGNQTVHSPNAYVCEWKQYPNQEPNTLDDY